MASMVYTAENELFTLAVKQAGAELTSFKSKKTGKEYIWCGDESIWYGQAPVLFPVIGKLLDDKYRLNGTEYEMPKHGLARKRPFELVSKKGNQLVFVQREDDETLKKYPYKYELYITFTIDGSTLRVNHRVVNTNESTMHFSIGAHPGFNCKIGDKLEFDVAQTLRTERIDAESIIIDETFPLLDNENAITVTEDIFKTDALILSGMKGENISLVNSEGKRYITFNYGSAPFLGIWAKPGAPYVCIEPWYGVNDSYDRKGDISQKRGINSLPAGESFEFSWSAETFE
ncbi:MAG: aldose 1-epimerase family protein [Clostridiales bacterium]|nr:aldose 1-epimerase family protein [Clostridiales bacterium]